MMWYIHYWKSNGRYAGFVDDDRSVGTAPDGSREQIKGPFSSREEAQRELMRMVDSTR